MSLTRRTIGFPGRDAQAVESPPAAGGDELMAALRLPPPGATIVVNGTAGDLGRSLCEQLSSFVGRDGVAGAALARRLTVVTGGTDAGIFSILGAALAAHTAPLVGVAPSALVTWPDRPAAGSGGPDRRRVPLEPHHSHFVLVDGDEWGDETGALLALARALGVLGPSVAVVCGGGPVTRHEALGHVRDGRPVVVLAGSGRFADELAAAVAAAVLADHTPAGLDPCVAEILAVGDVTVSPVSAGPDAFVRTVLAAIASR